ncbi:lactadherin [Nematostella vectensis]|uniref:lactadherin n=1 Tax=Nematostella vectensis TaxID=45351 RepID=UPI002076DE23|nr:lactadherin [Nematostella vectensis]
MGIQLPKIIQLQTLAMLSVLLLSPSGTSADTIFRDNEMFTEALFKTLVATKLDVPPKRKISNSDAIDCVLECLRDKACQSVNRRHGDSLCELIGTNKFQDHSALKTSTDYDHFYVTSECDRHPCRDGDFCRPHYGEGSYRCDCRENYTGPVCEHCTGPALGMEDGRIKDSQLSQSSFQQDPKYARLNRVEVPQGAQLMQSDTDGGWFLVDFLVTKVISAFAMQGYGNVGGNSRVTSFMISTSHDNDTWTFVKAMDKSVNIFPGNTDNVGIVKTTFSPPVVGRYFRITTKTCVSYCSFRLEFYGCDICKLGHALGMENRRVKAAQLSQSTYYDNNPVYGGDNARLNKVVWPQGAQLHIDNDDGGWFKVDFLRDKVIIAFAMQGYGNAHAVERTKRFWVSTSHDDEVWTFVKNTTSGSPKLFPGNVHSIATVNTTFTPPVIGRFFKVTTKECYQCCSFRLEFYGCDV